ncbi:MAG: hypothetical protein M1813_000555 [Trichoglossum hirsutum]|nr:MAG: hypothetical protein M1813_000555 [Trichoglossum hirsutum]
MMPLTATMVSAGCYGGGAVGDQSVAFNNIDEVCTSMQGYFEKTQTRNACYFKEGQNISWFFMVQRNAGAGGTLKKDQCINGLRDEAKCDHGGRSAKGDWVFKSDPNDGKCSDTTFINNNSRVKRSTAGAPQHARDFSVKERQPENGDASIIYDIDIPAPEPASKKRDDAKIIYDIDVSE